MDVGSAGIAAAKAAGEIAKEVGSDKIASILGSTFPFWGLKRRAVETYVKDIEGSNLPPETKAMLIINTRKTFREMKNQMAIADVAQSVARDGTDFSDASSVDDSWLSRFMDAGKHVSDEKVQFLWGNILAGEFETPGSTPPSVIRVLSEMTQKNAQVFANLCSLSCTLFLSDSKGEPCNTTPALIVPSIRAGDKLLTRLGINFSSVSELDTLGLLKLDVLSEYITKYSTADAPIIHIFYHNNVITCTSYPDRAFPIGCVLLTEVGECISRFVAKQNVVEYPDLLRSYLQGKRDVIISEMPQISIVEEAGTETGTAQSYRCVLIDTPRTQEPQQTSEV